MGKEQRRVRMEMGERLLEKVSRLGLMSTQILEGENI